VSFASTSELSTYVGSTVDESRAQQALDYATKKIRSHCGWSISQESLSDVSVDGSGTRDVWLDTLYLTAVSSVVDNDRSATLTFDVDYTWTKDGRLHRPSGWKKIPRLLSVTYTHGYVTVPDDVKGVCLSLAARRFDNPQSYRTERIDDYSYTVAATQTGAHSLLDAEIADLGPYRILPR